MNMKMLNNVARALMKNYQTDQTKRSVSTNFSVTLNMQNVSLSHKFEGAMPRSRRLKKQNVNFLSHKNPFQSTIKFKWCKHLENLNSFLRFHS